MCNVHLYFLPSSFLCPLGVDCLCFDQPLPSTIFKLSDGPCHLVYHITVNMVSVEINKLTSHSVYTLARDEAAGWSTPVEAVLTASAPVSASGSGSNSD